jgi:threonine dehydrogenase-like Zn-dependent dehydrogenase
MGQMHVQRAIELPDGPTLLIGTEVNDERLEAMAGRLAPLAESRGRRLVLFNPTTADQSLPELVMALTDGEGADDVVVSVPSAALMEEAAKLLKPDGMFVAFAGVPTGTLVPVNLSHVYLHNAQFTGTSGLTLDDQRLVMERTIAGDISPAHSVAAIGGLNVALEGLEGLIAGAFPGKIMIFPQLLDLPLMGLDEVAETLPAVAVKLGPGNTWTAEAEEALFRHYWEPEPAG